MWWQGGPLRRLSHWYVFIYKALLKLLSQSVSQTSNNGGRRSYLQPICSTETVDTDSVVTVQGAGSQAEQTPNLRRVVKTDRWNRCETPSHPGLFLPGNREDSEWIQFFWGQLTGPPCDTAVPTKCQLSASWFGNGLLFYMSILSFHHAWTEERWCSCTTNCFFMKCSCYGSYFFYFVNFLDSYL